MYASSRYARKDRRPLDPPPVVLFRLFEVRDTGTEREHEQELDAAYVSLSGIF